MRGCVEGVGVGKERDEGGEEGVGGKRGRFGLLGIWWWGRGGGGQGGCGWTGLGEGLGDVMKGLCEVAMSVCS